MQIGRNECVIVQQRFAQLRVAQGLSSEDTICPNRPSRYELEYR